MSPQNSLKYAQIIRPHQTSQAKAEEFFQRHLQQIPSSLRLAVIKVQVIEESIASAKPWSAAAAVPGAVDAEAAAAALVVAAKDIHSIRCGAPYRRVVLAGCGLRSACGQLTPAIGLPKDVLKLQVNH